MLCLQGEFLSHREKHDKNKWSEIWRDGIVVERRRRCGIPLWLQTGADVKVGPAYTWSWPKPPLLQSKKILTSEYVPIFHSKVCSHFQKSPLIPNKPVFLKYPHFLKSFTAQHNLTPKRTHTHTHTSLAHTSMHHLNNMQWCVCAWAQPMWFCCHWLAANGNQMSSLACVRVCVCVCVSVCACVCWVCVCVCWVWSLSLLRFMINLGAWSQISLTHMHCIMQYLSRPACCVTPILDVIICS